MCLIRVECILVSAIGISLVYTSSDAVPITNGFDSIDGKHSENFPAIGNILEIYPDAGFAGTTENCRAEMYKYLQGIGNREMWALKMFDASSKIQLGILNGNLIDLGMYDECIGVRSEDNAMGIQGRHCMYSLKVPSPSSRSFSTGRIGSSFGFPYLTYPKVQSDATSSITLTSSLCLPASCDEKDVLRIVNNTINMIPIAAKIATTTCSKVEAEDLTIGEIGTMTMLLFVVCFMVFCTICDFVQRSIDYRDSEILEILARFSLYRNAMRLLSTESSPDTMPAIHGLRFLSMCWVVLGHQYFTGLFRPLVNKADIFDWLETWHSLFILTAPLAVDSFFVISGFLMSYIFFKEMSKGRKFNLLVYYIHRYVRLTPTIAALMLLTIFVIPHIGSGPTWEAVSGGLSKACRKNWWTNLLYIQNFVNPKEMCMGHSWYLAVDMQLFWLSPIILVPLYRWPKIGWAIMSVFSIASLVIPAVVFAVNKYSNFFIRPETGIAIDVFVNTYITTYTRAAPWLIGIYLGHHVVDSKKRNTMTKVQIGAFWTLAVSAIASCILSFRVMQVENYEYNLIWETIYFTLSRPLWGAAIAWILYACIHGYGGPVTRLLSLPVLFPLSRLCYCIYLVHLLIQFLKNGGMRTAGYFSDFTSINHYWGDLVLSIGVAFIFSLFFESPFLVLEKILLKEGRKETQRLGKKSSDLDGEMVSSTKQCVPNCDTIVC